MRTLALLLLVPVLVSLSACDRTPSLDFADGDDALSAYRLETRVVEADGERWLEAEVTPTGPWKINLEYPWALRMQEGAGPRLRGEDASVLDEERAVFRVPASALAPGGDPEGMLNLSVCTPDVCLTPRERVRWTLAAHVPDDADAAPGPPSPPAEGGAHPEEVNP